MGGGYDGSSASTDPNPLLVERYMAYNPMTAVQSLVVS